MAIETQNDFLVGSRGREIIVQIPPRSLSKEQALRLAAWLVFVSMSTRDEFNAVLDAIMDT